MQEETFGPTLPIATFTTEDEAIRLANDSEFGLTASVWTRDLVKGKRVSAKIEAGTVCINEVLYTHGSVRHHGVVSRTAAAAARTVARACWNSSSRSTSTSTTLTVAERLVVPVLAYIGGDISRLRTKICKRFACKDNDPDAAAF
jgi:acyl-CoA reductase-like NAD-dependent aldehyde dehydrogenase